MGGGAGGLIAVLTPTIPGREHLLEECRASVRAQTLPAARHLVGVDDRGTGQPGPILNELARQCDEPWLAVLADDDLLLPRHLELHAEHFDNADVIYAYTRVEGRDDWDPNRPFDADTLRRSSCIPATCLVNRDTWARVKGWGDERRMEDWGFYLRCLQAGARFHCIEEATWVYRFHGDNKSLRKMSR